MKYSRLSPNLKAAVDRADARDAAKPPIGTLTRVKIKFTYYGKVLGKPRMTQRDRWANRPCVLRFWQFKDRLIEQFIQKFGYIPGSPVSLSWTAYIQFPKSYSKMKRETLAGKDHRQKPDRDNIDKGILDALFKEDKSVSSGTLRKLWDDGNGPRIEMSIIYETGEGE